MLLVLLSPSALLFGAPNTSAYCHDFFKLLILSHAERYLIFDFPEQKSKDKARSTNPSYSRAQCSWENSKQCSLENSLKLCLPLQAFLQESEGARFSKDFDDRLLLALRELVGSDICQNETIAEFAVMSQSGAWARYSPKPIIYCQIEMISLQGSMLSDTEVLRKFPLPLSFEEWLVELFQTRSKSALANLQKWSHSWSTLDSTLSKAHDSYSSPKQQSAWSHALGLPVLNISCAFAWAQSILSLEHCVPSYFLEFTAHLTPRRVMILK